MATATPQLTSGMTYPDASAPMRAATRFSCNFLSTNEFAEWDRFVDRSPHGTIFHYSWWLGITASSFRLLAIRDENGEIVGGLPLPVKHVAGLKLYHSPALAPYLGPVYALPSGQSEHDQLPLMRAYGEALARGMGRFDSYRCVAGAGAPNLQGFLSAGFRVSLAYTFRFSASQSIQEICKGITRTHMQKLTKAKRLELQIVRDHGLETLLELNKMTFKRQGSRPPFEDQTVLDLWRSAASRQKANTYLATTADGKPVAGLLTVHDTRTTYQIVSGFNSAFLDIPGQNLVLWMALQDALNSGRDFDFEGSERRGVEAFYRRWGAFATPVWRMEKAGTLRGSLAQVAIRHIDAKRIQNSGGRKSENK